MPLTIVQAGDPVLRRPARALRPNEIRSREIRELIEQMKETMHAAPGGVFPNTRSVSCSVV